jgi:hypothetical protein
MIKKYLFCLLFVLLLAVPGWATDYEWYFSTSGNDSTGDGSESTPWQTLSKINTQINTLTNGTDSATIYLKRGDTWTLTSNTGIQVTRSDVSIGAYGTGDKPIIDGDDYYPHDNHVNVITIGASGSSDPVTNVHIDSLVIQNTHNTSSVVEGGGGIQFVGTIGGASGTFTGPGSVTNCELSNFGWQAISIYRVPNTLGEDYAVKIENNYIHGTGWWSAVNSYTENGPQAINANDGYSSGHIARHNRIDLTHNEAIGAGGFALVEYNHISGTHNPSIYWDPRGASPAIPCIIRYNLVWSDQTYSMDTASGIRIYDEVPATGSNADADIQIYGNIIAGNFYAGLDIRNVSGGSNYGSVKAYNNTIIDTDRNIVLAYPALFNAIDIRNNASIIHSDVASSCVHTAVWNSGTYPASTTIGPNFYYGDSYDEEADLPSDWRDGTNVFGSSVLGKTSGWKSITDSPDLDDFTPQDGSDMIDNANTADLGDSYDEYLNSGEFSDLPDDPDFTLADQDDYGDEWDFGAIIFETGETQDYYVDCNADPGGDGTTQATTGANCAWDTIADVNGASLSAGDNVYFNRGCTWREQLTVPNSGSEGSPITFGAYGTGDDPVISGMDTTVDGFTEYSGSSTENAGDTGTSVGWRDSGYLYYVEAVTDSAGVLENYHLYYGATKPANVLVALYTDNSHAPGSLVANSESAEVSPSANSWLVVPPSGTVSLSAGTTYWIAFHQSSGAYAGSPRGGSNDSASEALAYGAMPANATSPSVLSYDGGSVYMSITVGEEVDNAYTATLTSDPYAVYFDRTKGVEVAGAGSLSEAYQWAWSSDELHVYSTESPENIEAQTLPFAIDLDSNDWVYFRDLNFENVNSIFDSTGSTNISIVDCDGSDVSTSNSFVTDAATGDITISGGTYISEYGSNTNKFMDYAGDGDLSISDLSATMSGNHVCFLSVSGANTGDINLSDNTITESGTASSGILYIVNGTHPTLLSGNSISSESATQSSTIVYIYDQDDTTVTGNTVQNLVSTAAMNGIWIRSGGTTMDVTATNNTIKISGYTGSGVLLFVGSDTAGAGDGYLDGATITGNQIYGAVYYDPTKKDCQAHGLLFGYSKNAIIDRNYINGAGIGIVVKGGLSAGQHSFTAGGISNNLVINTILGAGIYLRGMRDVPIYNNTIYVDSSLTMADAYPAPIKIGTNTQEGEDYCDGSVCDSQGAILKNNLILGRSSENLLYVDADSATNITSDYNLWWVPSGDSIWYYDGSFNGFSTWKAEGFDANSLNAAAARF